MKFTIDSKAKQKKLNERIWRAAAEGKIDKNTAKGVFSDQRYSLKAFILKRVPGASVERFWQSAVAVLLVSSSLFVATTTVSLEKEKAELADKNNQIIGELTQTNESLKNDKAEIEDVLNETIKELENSQNENKELQDTIGEQKEQLDNIASSSNDKIEDLEQTIKDLIDQFGISTESRGDNPTADDIKKIENAKNIIVSNLGSSEVVMGYISQLDEEQKRIQDEIDRYPDYQPCYGDMYLTQKFGYNTFTSNGNTTTRYHNGIDVAIGTGGTIYATGKGMVEEVCAVDKGGLGIYVKITHGNGYETLYAHLASANVQVGQIVEKGQKIGTMGKTGVATGIHLHLEYFYWGKRISPLDFVFKWWK